jgi:hypothetical protein
MALLEVLLLSLLVPAPSPGPRADDLYVDPRTYVSPDGRCTLFVDPHDRYGRGRGRYVMKRGSAVGRERQFPWTLRDAEIDDDGWVIGFAYTRGDLRFVGVDGGGDVRMVVLAPDGGVRVELAEARGSNGYACSGNTPHCRGFTLAREFDRAFFCLATAGQNRTGERLCAARVSSGERLPDVDLRPKFVDIGRLRDVLAVRSIPGRPFVALQFQTSRPLGASLFALLGHDGEPLWTELVEDEFTLGGGVIADPWLSPHLGAFSLGPDPGQVSFVDFSNRRRNGFRVEERPSDRRGWVVESVATEPYDTDAFVKARRKRAPEVTYDPAPFGLDLVDVQRLETGGPCRVEFAGSDGRERLFFAEPRSIDVLELALDGRAVRTWRAPAETRRVAWSTAERVTVASDGSLFVQSRSDETQPVRAFASDGRFLGSRSNCGVEWPRRDGGGRWVAAFDHLILEDAAGREVVRRERSASGVWLRSLWWVQSLGPDGSIALQGRELSVFGADGEPVAAGPVLGRFSTEIANAGSRVFAYDERRVLVFDVRADRTWQIDVTRDTPSADSFVAVWIESLGELWLVARGGAYALRYRVAE